MPDVYEWTFIISGLIFFGSIIGIFISAANEKDKLLRCFGVIIISLLIPLLIVFINFLVVRKDLRLNLYMILILLYIVVELFLDFIFKIEFRNKTITHVPYIILEYAACFSFIFISFSINRTMGWVISICFWAMLVSLIYLIIIKKKNEKKL